MKKTTIKYQQKPEAVAWKNLKREKDHDFLRKVRVNYGCCGQNDIQENDAKYFFGDDCHIKCKHHNPFSRKSFYRPPKLNDFCRCTSPHCECKNNRYHTCLNRT